MKAHLWILLLLAGCLAPMVAMDLAKQDECGPMDLRFTDGTDRTALGNAYLERLTDPLRQWFQFPHMYGEPIAREDGPERWYAYGMKPENRAGVQFWVKFKVQYPADAGWYVWESMEYKDGQPTGYVTLNWWREEFKTYKDRKHSQVKSMFMDWLDAALANDEARDTVIFGTPYLVRCPTEWTDPSKHRPEDVILKGN